MAGRNRLPATHPSRGPLPPPYTRSGRPDEPPVPFGAPPPPPPQLILEERMAAQFDEIHALLADNQRLAATHVALKQEVNAVQYELRRASVLFESSLSETDVRLREAYDRSAKMEEELRGAEGMKAELIQVQGDIQKLHGARQELMNQVQVLSQDLNCASANQQQMPAIKAEIETMKQEIQRVRAAIEQEKKGYAENYEQGQVMEKNLISMAREVEKLRAEIANAEKRARAAAAAGNQTASYGVNYGNPEPNYASNPYPPGYGMNPVPGVADPNMQYGWNGYDMQRAQGRRLS